MDKLEADFIEVINTRIQQLERLKQNPKNELQTGCFNLYCLTDNLQMVSIRLCKRYDELIGKVRNIHEDDL
jgi:hypothetical protein